jgi:prepilin-type processing-associated H-X9-DG protein
MANFAVFEDGDNGAGPPWSMNPNNDAVVSEAEIQYPSESTMWYDSTITGPPSFYSPAVPRHSEGANATFCDGHAKIVRFTNVDTFSDPMAGTFEGGMVASGPYSFEGPGNPKDLSNDYPDELWGVVFKSGGDEWVSDLR